MKESPEKLNTSNDNNPENKKDLSYEKSETPEGALIGVDKIEQGKPASFIVYHGSDKPFVTAIPSEKFPTVFYADKPSVASTYPWGKYLNELSETANKLSDDKDVLIGAKILLTHELNNPVLPGPKPFSSMELRDYHLKEPEVIALQERLEHDRDFRRRAERLLSAWDDISSAYYVKKEEVADFETGPLGSVREYLVSAKNPLIFDFQGHTWGDIPDETVEGGWLKPTRRATTEQLRVYWNEWLNKFFEKGYDIVVIKNIRDIGSNIGSISEKPHTTVVVGKDAKVEVAQLNYKK
ncbi:MAG: hypothetical protein UW71_C0011G0009 [Parcubacteria group bacterium GW2011_GWB1_44_7]|nr:MAG: hypothetical protein UW71_C0011G0009 [Parcubacteria group bacterium GW2011_GWB1_44_7]